MTRTHLTVGLSLLALIACTDTALTPSDINTVMQPAKGDEPKAKPITGGHEVTERINGKAYRIQMRMQNGAPVAQMMWQDSIPMVLTEFTLDDKRQIKSARNTFYDAEGNPTFIAEHEIRKQSRLGRCLQLLLPDQLYAQVIVNNDCSRQATEMGLAGIKAAAAATAARLVCVVPGPLCTAALLLAGAESASYLIAVSAYNICKGGLLGGLPGGTSTTTSTRPAVGGNTGATSGGTCWDVTTTVYSLKTGMVIGQPSTETVCN